MVALLKKEDLEAHTLETVAHLLFISLVQMSQMKSQVPLNQTAKDTSVASGTGPSSNLIFLKYWEHSSAFLKLSVLNELVQTFRTNNRILEPILRVLFIMGKNIEKEVTVGEG